MQRVHTRSPAKLHIARRAAPCKTAAASDLWSRCVSLLQELVARGWAAAAAVSSGGGEESTRDAPSTSTAPGPK